MKQFHITYSTAWDTHMNGIVLCGLLAATQSHCGICWVTGALIRRSSYTSEQRVDSRTPTVISRCSRLRPMFLLPPLPFSLPLMQQWKPCHQDILMAPSLPTFCGHSPFPLLCPEVPHMCAIAASTTGRIHWLHGRPDSLFLFPVHAASAAGMYKVRPLAHWVGLDRSGLF